MRNVTNASLEVGRGECIIQSFDEILVITSMNTRCESTQKKEPMRRRFRLVVHSMRPDPACDAIISSGSAAVLDRLGPTSRASRLGVRPSPRSRTVTGRLDGIRDRRAIRKAGYRIIEREIATIMVLLRFLFVPYAHDGDSTGQ